MASLAEFKDKLAPFELAAARIVKSGSAWTVPEDVAELFRKQSAKENATDFNVALFGSLDADKTIALAQAGVIAWWLPFTGKAYVGDLDGMQKIWKATSAANNKQHPSSTMTWISQPYNAAGLRNKIRADVLAQLFDWGADPHEKKDEWLQKALHNLDGAPLAEFVRRAKLPSVFRIMEEISDPARLGQIQDALQKPVSYVKADNDTLSETKFIPDAQGGATMKTLFNFRARRITEIYETADRKTATMQGASFDDYDSAAIDFARDKLAALGGTPADSLAKPRFKGLSGPS